MGDKTLPYILTDCDGTITMTYNNILPETLANILAYQKKSQNHLSFVTGRNGIVMKQLVEMLKINLPIISCNGALITDSKSWKVLDAQYLDKDVLVRLVRWADELGIHNVIFEPDAITGIKGTSRTQYWSDYQTQNNMKKQYAFKMNLFDDASTLAETIVDDGIQAVEMILAVETKAQMKAMKEYLAKFSDKIDYSQSHKVLFNITKKGVNKASALKKWAEIMKTDYQDVVVFGDNFNDIDVVKSVNHGYAVGDSVKELKEVAFKVIGKLEDDGVGVKLQEIMNNEY